MKSNYTRAMGRQIASAHREWKAAQARGETWPNHEGVSKLAQAYARKQRERAEYLFAEGKVPIAHRAQMWTHRELGLALRLRSDKEGKRRELLGCAGMTEERVRALGRSELRRRQLYTRKRWADGR